jgi:hypothetical protein
VSLGWAHAHDLPTIAQNPKRDHLQCAVGLAPDREKLLALAATIRATPFPDLPTMSKQSQDVVGQAASRLGAVAKWIETRAEAL